MLDGDSALDDVPIPAWSRTGAWWLGSASDLLETQPVDLVTALNASASERYFSIGASAQVAWISSVNFLHVALRAARDANPAAAKWGVLLEFDIPRRSVRPDAVVLVGGAVVVIEFKVGSSIYGRADQMQVTEYARDLTDFHEASRSRVVIPVLVASDALNDDIDLEAASVDRAQLVSPPSLAGLLLGISERFGSGDQIELETWNAARYRPTPSILEAARDVYAGHEVAAISHSYADNLEATVEAVRRAIDDAITRKERRVCFVTGVPGSGKTLAGLSAVHKHDAAGGDADLGTYLSGNGPLVDVLRYAIAVDLRARTGCRAEEAKRRASVFIQPVQRFLDELAHSDHAPPEHVIVFDEAQRAWDAAHTSKEKGIDQSEAELTLEIMERPADWSVVVALIGGGQEINRGEAGVGAWLDALGHRPAWQVSAPPGLAGIDDGDLSGRVTSTPALHLSVGVRAPRARTLADWADAVVKGDFTTAGDLASQLDGYPLLLTRDLDVARSYLNDRARPDRRVGLLASSQARRLRAFGLELDTSFQRGIDWPRWFVDPSEDFRSSYALEVAASEFKCQGLELDWVGLCWGCDFLPTNGSWIARRIRGNGWSVDADMTHAMNRYRVLLTRARYGLVIWVPAPDPAVPLMDAKGLDRAAQTLRDAGVIDLDSVTT